MQKGSCNTLAVDVIAQFRTISKELPKTFEGLIIRFLESLPKSYSRVDLVADCYRDFTIKAGERETCGSSEKIFIKSWKPMLPRDMGNFYSNGEKKNQLINLTFNFMKEHPSGSLSLLKCNTIFWGWNLREDF